MIVCSQLVTSSSLTVDAAVQALPTQHKGSLPVMHSLRSERSAQLAACWQKTESTDSHWSPSDRVVVVVVVVVVVPPSLEAGPNVHAAWLTRSAAHTIAGATFTSGPGPYA